MRDTRPWRYGNGVVRGEAVGQRKATSTRHSLRGTSSIATLTLRLREIVIEMSRIQTRERVREREWNTDTHRGVEGELGDTHKEVEHSNSISQGKV